MLRYWFALIQGRFKLWQLLLLGAAWIAGGVVIQLELGVEVTPFAAILVLSGVAHWLLAWRALRLQESTAARLAELDRRAQIREERDQPHAQARREPEPGPETQRRHPQPRISDDPFRNPPAAPPIVVVRTAAPPAVAPIVAGDPSDKPKLLG